MLEVLGVLVEALVEVEVLEEVVEVGAEVVEVVEEGTGVQRRWRRPYRGCQEKTIPS